jgi:hypothetical protein
LAEQPHVRCVMLTGRAARGDAAAEARAPVPKQTPRNVLVFPLTGRAPDTNVPFNIFL